VVEHQPLHAGIAGDASGLFGEAVAGEQMLLQPCAVAGPRHEPFDALFQHGLMNENVGPLGKIGQRREESGIG